MVQILQHEFNIRTKIHYGVGTHAKVSSIVSQLNRTNAMVVTDPGLIQAGVVEQILSVLREEKIKFCVFDKIITEPTDEYVTTGTSFLNESGCDVLVAIGGGSVMDSAKCIGVMANNPGRINDYEGSDAFKNDSPYPLIALPTTSGTGAELSSWAVITDSLRSYKMTLGSPYLAPDYALIDPLLTVSLPPGSTAQSGMDALSQSIEGMLSRRRSPIGEILGLYAVQIITQNLPIATRRGWDIQARANMALGSFLGGMIMEQCGCIIVHSIAETLGGFYHIPHGLAVGLVLPHVLKFNFSGDIELLAKIANAMGVNTNTLTTREAANQAIDRINQLLTDIEFPTLKEVGLKEIDIPEIARISYDNVSTPDNPYPVNINDFENILKKCVLDD